MVWPELHSEVRGESWAQHLSSGRRIEMRHQWDKTIAGGGEGIEENALSIEYFVPLVAGGGEGIEPNLFGSEYVDSLAPIFSDGSGDYGIWTSLPDLSPVEIPRKKKAA
jgi:hypothetical protein